MELEKQLLSNVGQSHRFVDENDDEDETKHVFFLEVVDPNIE